MNYSKKWNLFHARSNLTPKTTTASLPHPQSIIPPLMRSVILKVTLSCPIFACLARDRWSLHPKETPNDACLAQTPAGTPPLVTGRRGGGDAGGGTPCADACRSPGGGNAGVTSESPRLVPPPPRRCRNCIRPTRHASSLPPPPQQQCLITLWSSGHLHPPGGQ